MIIIVVVLFSCSCVNLYMVCTKFQRLLQIGWRCVFYLIRKNQTAFIQGRRIAEKMLLAQENVTYYT